MARFRRSDWVLFAVTALLYGAFLPVRLMVGAKAGCAFTAPDMNFPTDFAAYGAAKSCLTGNDGAGVEAFVRWHLLGLDLVFPALLAFAVTVFLLRIGAGLPRFAALAPAAKLVAAGCLPLSYAIADYAENWQVASWLNAVDDGGLPLISTLTTLKFAALIVAAVAAIALYLSALKNKGLS